MTASSATRSVAAFGLVLAVCLGVRMVSAETPALTLRATVVGHPTVAETLRIELLRWSTDAERAPLVAAASTLNRPPAPPAPAAAAAGGRAGRGGARGRGAEAPVSPLAQLTGAIKAAPTVGFIWGQGVSGYSVKYAWRATQPDGSERIVLVTDRRLGAHSPAWLTAAPAGRGGAAAATAATDAAAEAEFTVIEMRVDGKGAGEGKTSLTTRVVVDTPAQTLALDGYAAAPALLKVER